MNWMRYHGATRGASRRDKERWVREKLQEAIELKREQSRLGTRPKLTRTAIDPGKSLFLKRLIHLDRATGNRLNLLSAYLVDSLTTSKFLETTFGSNSQEESEPSGRFHYRLETTLNDCVCFDRRCHVEIIRCLSSHDFGRREQLYAVREVTG